MLLSKSKKEKKPAQQLSDEQRIEQRRRKTRRRLIAGGVTVAAVIAILALLPEAASTGGQITAEESVLSVQAQTGNIDTVFCGSGSLADGTATEIKVPATVEVLGYTVTNGQSVKEGDVIAVVEQSSVLAAAAELQEKLDTLDEEIETAAADNISSMIAATTDGRVKVIYAEKYKPVLDTMYEHGALILVSLDGLMALDIPADGLVPGQSVTVTLSDGTVQTGSIAQIDDGVATVTTADEVPDYGEFVTVSDLSGGKLGEGELYIHSELKVTGFTGTAHDIYVMEDWYIYAEQGLIALTDTEYEGNYDSLIKTRAKYARQMEELMQMYQKGYVCAGFDGIVTGIEDGAKYLSLSAADTSAAVSGLAYSGADVPRVSLLSAAGDPQTTVTKYVGKVSAVSYGQISLMINPNPVNIDGSSLDSVDQSSCTTAQQISPDAATAVYVYDNGVPTPGGLDSVATGDTVLMTFEGAALSRIDCVHAAAEQTPGGQQSGGTAAGGNAGTGTGKTAAANTVTPDSTQEAEAADTVVCSLVPGDKMSLVISVDELDVLSLAVGQSAQVILDAVSGQSFDAVVTELDPIGVNDGGSTKYSLTLTLDRTELMRSGMNASTRITVASAENVLLIPENALYEDGSRIFVYTGYDKKNDVLTGEVTVTTGVSDGENVQILSGLEAGTAVYYRFADSLVYRR